MGGMVCSVWLRMSLTGKERGQRSDRVVSAAREDGAEECGVIFFLKPSFDAAEYQIGPRGYS